MYTIYKDDDVEVLVEKEPDIMEGVFLHLNLNNWSVSKFKRYQQILKMITKQLRDNGMNKIYATAPPGKPEKLIKMFGLKETGITFSGFKLMEVP